MPSSKHLIFLTLSKCELVSPKRHLKLRQLVEAIKSWTAPVDPNEDELEAQEVRTLPQNETAPLPSGLARLPLRLKRPRLLMKNFGSIYYNN
jgi:hypothetical protein